MTDQSKTETQISKKAGTGKKNNGSSYVRMDTLLITAIACLIVGFFAGELINMSKPAGHEQTEMSANGQPSTNEPHLQTPSPEQLKRISELEQKVITAPEDVATWVELGNLYFDTRQPKSAIKAYRKALDLNSYDTGVWTDLGVMYRADGQPLEAIKAFDKAITIDPKHEQSRFNKGIVLIYDMGDRQSGIRAWEELLQVNPNAMASDGQSVKAQLEAMKKQAQQPQPGQ